MNNIGILYSILQKNDLAEKYFLEAIKNNDKDAIFNLGLLYKNLLKYKRAEEYLLKSDLNNPEVLFQLGLVFDLQNNLSNAIKYYEKAIEKEHVNAMHNLAMFLIHILIVFLILATLSLNIINTFNSLISYLNFVHC